MNRILQTLTLFALFMVFSTYIQAQCVVTVKQPSQLTATISGTTDICSGDSTTITIILKGGRAPWTITHPGQTTPLVVNDSDGVNDTTFTYTYQETYYNTTGAPTITTYDNTTVTVTDSRSCTSIITGSAVITVNPIPTIAATGPTKVCPGAPIVLNVTNPNSVTGATFSWTATDGTNSYGSDTDVAFGDITINTNAADCNKTITVTLTPKGPGTTYCEGTPIPKNIIVRDSAAPTLIAGQTIPLGQTDMDLCFANIPAGPTADDIKALYEDACNGVITVTKSGAPTGNNCSWNVTYTYEVKDACGNTVAPSPTVTYSGGDVSAPTLAGTIPSGQTGMDLCFADIPAGPTEAEIRALFTDNCTATDDITVTKTGTPTGDNCSWSVTYTYEVKDACNNIVATSPTVTYSGGDKTAPTLAGTIPSGETGMDLCFSAIPAGPTEAEIRALFTDNCTATADITVTKTGTPTGDNCNWSVTYIYEVKDACNNIVATSPTVTYSGSDQTNPTITCVGDQSRTVPGAVNYTTSGTEFDPTAFSDNCDANPVLSYELSGATTVASTTASTLNGVVFQPGTTTVKWTVKDACNNEQSCTFTVSVTQFSFTYIVTDLSCFESGDGKIVVTAVGGVEPIQFSKDDGATWESSDSGAPRTKTFDNLPAGDYPIKIKDANGVETTVCSAP